ncbi:MAG: beta-glucosidase [Anaerolineae bacterium]|nr:beta-glucosidase [Anaerolineae bacterium]
MDFPKDFMWGVATSSYQIEGAVHADGRGESIWDRFTHTPGAIKDGSTGDVACDHYHRYREDVALMQSLGVKAYRFSVAWPRILPQGTGEVNQAGLDFYSRLVDALLEAGITPFVTLYHWDLPQALEDRGGWNNRDTAEAFAAYADVMTRRLGDRARYWMTHNEPWCTAFLGYDMGIFAPGIKDLKVTLQVSHHLLLSHGLAVPAMRANLGDGAAVGIAPNFMPVYPATDAPEDRAAARRLDGLFNRWFADPLFGKGYPQDTWDLYGENVPDVQPGDIETLAAPVDFLGVNYYNPGTVADAPDAPPPHLRDVSDPDLERTADRIIYPEGLYDILVQLHRDYNPPALYITENGAAFHDEPGEDSRVHDAGRIAFLEAHFAQAARALKAGVPLKGYFVWTLMDNFEWAAGYTLRYGITWVDFETQRRIPKDSALWYRDFIRKHS